MASSDLHQALRARFGLHEFRPGQEEAAGAVLAGRDLVAVMPTGSGKSLSSRRSCSTASRSWSRRSSRS
jgi:superfamily II DNA helicase RecQ